MLLERFRLDGKVAVITGAGRGIGRGCALGFAEAGAHVVCAARTVEEIEETVDLARAFERREIPLVLTMPSFNHHGLSDGKEKELQPRCEI